MIPTRRALIAGSVCLAGALAFPGCASDRTPRAQSTWARIWSPFRIGQQPPVDPEVEPRDPAVSLVPPALPESSFGPAGSTDTYYDPRSTELSAPLASPKPPAAPPAVEPGFLDEQSAGNAQNTSGHKPHDGRPARLRDVFDNFGRKQPTPPPRPRIPLDEPVAFHPPSSAHHVVGYERAEPVALGRPEFAE